MEINTKSVELRGKASGSSSGEALKSGAVLISEKLSNYT